MVTVVPDSRQLAVALVAAGRGGARHGRRARPGGSCGPSGRHRTRRLRGRRRPGRGRPCPAPRPAAPRRRRPAARCRRPAPASRSALCTPPPVATMRRASAPPRSRMWRTANAERLVAPPARRPPGPSRCGGRAATPGGPGRGAAPARRGGRAARPGSRRGRGPAGRSSWSGSTSPSRRRTQSRNRPPAFDGPPISVLPGVVWGTVQTPSTSTHSGVTAQTMSGGAEDHEHVAVVDRPRHELLAERVDRARPDHRAGGRPAGGDRADRAAPRHQRRKARGVVEARVLRHRRRPSR